MAHRIGPAAEQELPAVFAFIARVGAERVARRGELVPPREHPAVVAWEGSDVRGVVTYVVSGRACELLTVHADPPRGGVGTAMLACVEELARAAGCTRLWVVTTNDNLGALRFYQRRGFALCALRPGAVDASRRELKPEIPAVGSFGIPLRDELELEKTLPAAASGGRR